MLGSFESYLTVCLGDKDMIHLPPWLIKMFMCSGLDSHEPLYITISLQYCLSKCFRNYHEVRWQSYAGPTIIVLRGYNFRSIEAVFAHVPIILISCVRCSSDFWECSSLTLISSNFFVVSTQCFDSILSLSNYISCVFYFIYHYKNSFSVWNSNILNLYQNCTFLTQPLYM
jgi:hypothetical protein